MRLRDAISTLSFRHKREKLNVLYTRWGEEVALESKKQDYVPLREYPRPQMKREQYEILNGWWKYQIVREKTWEIPRGGNFQGEILVPFSPESALSGVGRQLLPGETLWYSRDIWVNQEEHQGKRLLLHFGAVDQECRIYWNGVLVGAHMGGYLPFSLEITGYVKEGINHIWVACRDDSDTGWHSRGKQKLEAGGMFYTAQSGIWQTVWMEWVPDYYVHQLKITPEYDDGALDLGVYPEGGSPDQQRPLEVEIFEGDRKVCHHKAWIQEASVTVHLKLPGFRKWSPEDPFLYSLRVKLGEDRVESYFAMRVFSKEPDTQGTPRLCLNHRPYFFNGVLDQGYWPDGLYTAPTDEALRADILRMKKHGFRLMRKHCKIEPLRWYYHCDRLGMVVWQDMVNGGETYDMKKLCYLPTIFPRLMEKRGWSAVAAGRKNMKGCQEWLEECKETIRVLYNSPSVGAWVIFNEGWGQFATEPVTRMVKKADPTRPVDSASGWFDCDCGDIKSTHNYFDALTCPRDKKREKKEEGRACVISEYGGLSLAVEDHISGDQVYGYKKMRDREEFQSQFRLMQQQIRKLQKNGLSAAIYTQVSDIEDEINGIYTYDRKICKLKERS